MTVGIVLTTLLSLLATSLLYYRWAKRPDADARIIVWKQDPSWDGATVVVRGGGLDAPLKYVLRSQEHQIVRFHVPPGDYQVQITDKQGRREQIQTDPRAPMTAGSMWWPFDKTDAVRQLDKR